MTIEARRVADRDEFERAFYAIGQYFGPPPTEERVERWFRNFDIERMHAAYADGQIVGGAGAFTFELTVPGATVPTAGVTIVGVYPTHRRRGALRAMMQVQLEDVRERGEPLAALWASEETIYGRFGYGMASAAGETSIARPYGAFGRPLERRGELRFVEEDDGLDVVAGIYERVRLETPGMISRTRNWWQLRHFLDPEDRREGGGPKRWVVLSLDGEDQAYAQYRHHPGWEDGSSSARLVVNEALGATPQATAEIWRYLLDVDWIATVEASLIPPDHPLFFLLATPRRMRYRMGDGIWVRLIDVGAALSARSYAAEGSVVFDVVDPFLPDNSGRWKLADGEATRTSDSADLRLDVADLGSAYLGGFTFSQLARAGRVEELVTGALARADAMFRSERHPWCPEIF